ncbi:MAG: SDR family NAD(P)-dependent oxidoreductase, partial [Planctomycetota bacterium]
GFPAATGRRVLIIGNSDGIGAAVTEQLVAHGDHVVGISRSGSPLGEGGPRHEVQDVAASGYRELLLRLLQEEGSFDACIFCVGIGSGLELPDLSREAHVIDVNFLQMVRTLEVLVPHWLERKSGHFIGLSSLVDDLYNHDAPSYSASKAGFSNYLVSMALKLRRHGVAVTNIRFGFVDTKMAKSSVRPLMISREAAARHVVRCLETRPIQLSVPKLAGALIRLARWAQSLRVWTG